MKTKLLFGLSLVAILFAGCVVQSIQPLFSEKDSVEYPALIGTWKQQDENKEISVWTFSKDGEHYKLVHTDENGRRASFAVIAGKIGTNVFLDLVLTEIEPHDSLNALAQFGLIPAHGFVKVLKTGDGLLLVAMNYDWLEKQLQAHPETVTHAVQDKRFLLTASTGELKSFVAKYANDAAAFQNEIRLMPKSPVK